MASLAERLYVSTACLSDKRDLRKVLEIYQYLGISRVEISGAHDWISFEDLAGLIKQFQARNMRFIFHNYFPRPKQDFVLNVMSSNAFIQNQTQGLMAQAIKLAKVTGVDLYCFHAGYLADAVTKSDGMFDFPGQKTWLNQQEAEKIFFLNYQRFFKEFDSTGVLIGLENLFPPRRGPNPSTCCSFEDIQRIMEIPWIKNSDLGLLIDLGHLKVAAHILGFNPDEFLDQVVDAYGPKIYEVHLSENDGLEDLHRVIEKGSWQLKCLGKFIGTGPVLSGKGTRFSLESRGLEPDELKKNYELMVNEMEGVF
ncbi:MAG: TIM barrel protein [Candidatus Omnitrophica bacterium]|nr:TIM barrel protein [Candidatus Omnitrophota bacterium]